MPRVSTWFIRAAMLHFLSGAMIGAAFLAWKAVGWFMFAPGHLGVHVEQMLVGWLVQLTMGVAFWVLPRRQEAPVGEGSGLMWVVFVLINAGVLLGGLGEGVAWRSTMSLAGRIAECTAAALFAVAAWNRQRAYRATTRRVLV